MSQRNQLIGIFSCSFVFLYVVNIVVGVSPLTGDEIWAATSILGNPLDSIVFTLRFDLHPPVYYSIIDIWALINKGDLWLRSSSMVTHSALVLSIYYITKKLHNDKIAITASLLVLVSPLLLEYSNQLRMYSLISLQSIWIFYFTDEMKNKGFSKKRIFSLFSLELLLVYTHAIGILFVFFHFMYGVLVKNLKQRIDFILMWGLFHLLVFCLSVPVIVNSWVRYVEHAVAPDLGNIISVISMANINIYGMGSVFSFTISILVVALLLNFKKTRVLAFCYIILPIMMFLIISYALKPLWLVRNFAFAFPLIIMAQSIVLHEIFQPIKRGQIYLYICVFLIMSSHLSIYLQYINNKNDGLNFNNLSLHLKNAALNHEKTCITTNILHTFWSLLRYNIALEWGHPLIIQPPLTDRWKNIISKIPSGVVQSLRLMPDKNYYEGDVLIVAFGWSERCRADDIEQILIIDEKNMIDEINVKSNKIETFGPYTIYQVIDDR